MISSHKVAKYNFKNFDSSKNAAEAGASVRPHANAAPLSPAGFSDEEKSAIAAIQARQAEEEDSLDALVGKIDDLSASIVKLQTRLERQEEEFAAKIKEERERSFEDGRKAGQKEERAAFEGELNALREQFAESFSKFDTAISEFGNHAASLDKELSSIAVEIAGEVIAKEVGENSAKIASALASALLGELRGANKVTIRVSPDDARELNTKFAGEGGVTIVPDKAIAKGGVVIFSDAGNMDAQIQNRFAAIRKSILESGN
jgi:flagellar assembly protein FliH